MLQPPGGKPWLLYGILGVSLTLNLVMALRWPKATPATAPEDDPTLTAAAEPAVDAGMAADPAAVAAGDDFVPAAGEAGGYQIVHASIQSNPAAAFQEAVGEKGDAVGAVFNRIFVWDVDPRRDVQKGDEMVAAWRMTETNEIDMPVAWYKSSKLGKTLKAYQFQNPSDQYPSYWYLDGTEVPYRLKAGPLDNYVQITSLLADRSRHKGWDFKTPVGTPVKSPRAGRVERVNWNFTSNGDCVEVRQDDGITAMYLHLDSVSVAPGDRVGPGQVIAMSGNTGHSTAPHLHYQVERGGKVLDPGVYHGLERRKLDPAALPALQEEAARLDALLATPVAEN